MTDIATRQYWRLDDHELLLEAQMEAPMIDPRIWAEVHRRDLERRLYQFLDAATEQ